MTKKKIILLCDIIIDLNLVICICSVILFILFSKLKLTAKIENDSFGEEQTKVTDDSQQNKNQQEQHQQYLGDTSQGLPHFKPVEITEPLPGTTFKKMFFLFS